MRVAVSGCGREKIWIGAAIVPRPRRVGSKSRALVVLSFAVSASSRRRVGSTAAIGAIPGYRWILVSRRVPSAWERHTVRRVIVEGGVVWKGLTN